MESTTKRRSGFCTAQTWGSRLGLCRALVIGALVAICLLITGAAQPAQAQGFTTLYSFKGGTDGRVPAGRLVRDSLGDLYGTTELGGTSSGSSECPNGCGTVFELHADGRETILYNFKGLPGDGYTPIGALITDNKGNFYGTTFGGGTGTNWGTVFKIDASGKETVLHNFAGSPSDGAAPVAGLAIDTAGNLYGTTFVGGNSGCGGAGCGIVFELDSSGNETILHKFTGTPSDGAYPEAGVTIDTEGNLYGTTNQGGTYGQGTVFKIDTSGYESILYNFKGGTSDGAGPLAGLVIGTAGNLYGTTYNGGSSNCAGGCGIVFKLDSFGTEAILHKFTGSQGDGANPRAGLAADAAGNLYGTTNQGGTYGHGTVFKIDTSGFETSLHSFTGSPNEGATPVGSLITDTSGHLYGTTYEGGTSGYGTVFSLTPNSGSGCSLSPTFAEVIANGRISPPGTSPGTIDTDFQPGCNFNLSEAAHLGGYDHFNWLQVVTDDTILSNPLYFPYDLLTGLTYCSPGYIGGIWFATNCEQLPIVPYIDPPPGGYAYEGASIFGPVEDDLDWYADEQFTAGPPYKKADPSAGECTQLENFEYFGKPDFECSASGSNQLHFEDNPSCPIASLGLTCSVNFSTSLVGVRSDGTGNVLNFGNTGFDWHAVGTTIGVDQRRQSSQPDTGTLVEVDGFKSPGAAGFSQSELELLAKRGINIRDAEGIIVPLIIDIKPGSNSNPINPESQGKIPVAILSTTSFSAPSDVDVNSLSFGRSGNERSLAFCNSKGEDVNGDGLVDLMCHFYASKTGFVQGDTVGILTGKTISGTSLFGIDSVVVVPRH